MEIKRQLLDNRDFYLFYLPQRTSFPLSVEPEENGGIGVRLKFSVSASTLILFRTQLTFIVSLSLSLSPRLARYPKRLEDQHLQGCLTNFSGLQSLLHTGEVDQRKDSKDT